MNNKKATLIWLLLFSSGLTTFILSYLKGFFYGIPSKDLEISWISFYEHLQAKEDKLGNKYFQNLQRGGTVAIFVMSKVIILIKKMNYMFMLRHWETF